jgi:tetratricopeptide (TPR) repeat protein
MGTNSKTTAVVLGVLFLFSSLFMVQKVCATNIITGTIYDIRRNYVGDVDVELLDEYYRVVRRAKTDSVGRYEFSVENNGNYTVRVLPFRYDLEEVSQYIEISSISARPGETGSSYNVLDFYLQPKKGGLRETELSVVFAQEVPKDAEKAYKKAIEDLSNRRTDEGISGLRTAVRLFPKYYAALYRLGQELFVKNKYGESAQFFIKAADINQKSATSFYYIGYALYNLGETYDKAAITSLNQAHTLAPASVPILWLLGKIERETGKFTDAEKHLLQAKKLAQNKIAAIHQELSKLYADNLKKYKEAADELELYLKASKASGEDEKKARKVISGLREKAKAQTNNFSPQG